MKKKKILKSLFTILLMITSLFKISMPIMAESGNVVLEDHGNRWRIGLNCVFTDRYLGTTRNITSIRIDNFTVNGNNAYCIEPNVEIYPSIPVNVVYGQEALNAMYAAGYSQAQIDEMALISSLGYGYAQDTTATMNAATQVRIWQVFFGDVISNVPSDVQAKIDIINERMHKMNTPVSFENQTLELKGYGEKYAITLEDTNGVFSDYVENTISDGAHIERNGNTLKLWVEEGASESGEFIFDAMYSSNEASNNYIAYIHPHNQTLAAFGKVTPRQLKFNYQVQKSEGQIKLNKQGEVLTGVNTTTNDKIVKTEFIYEEKNLANTQFEVYASKDIYDPSGALIYKKGTKVDTIQTDENGIATTKELLFGTYTLKETVASNGFIINQDSIEIEIKLDESGQSIIETKMTNQRAHVQLNLKKLSSKTNAPLENALYGLYAKEDIMYKDTLIMESGTLIETTYSDENGILNFESDLPLALYELKELEPCPGYSLNEEIIEIDARYIDQNTKEILIKKELKNDFNNVSICVNKVDKNSEPIKNKDFTFGLFKDKECKEMIESKSADTKTGTVFFNDLGVQTYYVKELEAPEGYKLSNEVICFDVQEYGKVFINEKEVTTNEDLIYSYNYVNEKLPNVPTSTRTNLTMYGLLIGISSLIFIVIRKIRNN